MAIRLGLGPVFYYERVISSRRWQMYVGRSLFVLMLLLALSIVWYTESDGRSVTSLRGSRKLLAELGEKFFYAVIGTLSPPW